MDAKTTQKKGVINQVIGIFALVLVVSIIVGITFLFLSQMKTNVVDSTPPSGPFTITNENLTNVTSTGRDFSVAGLQSVHCTITNVTANLPP